MLAQLIAINVVSPLYQKSHLQDQLPISPDRLTRFHSRYGTSIGYQINSPCLHRATPQISVTDYLNRMVRYSSLEKASLLAAVYYIDLLSQRFPAFTLSSLTVHRFLITAVTVASKGLCDAFCTNTHYAKVGGIGVAELNMLELEFLKRVEWLIVPEPTVLEAYYRSMVAQDPRYRLESEANNISLHPDGTS